jgi:hypothetical protein
MTDCPNAEMRDRLPELLHERLEASTVALVLAHVEACSDCRAELALLREARIALSSGVRSVDVTAIASVVVARSRFTPSVEHGRSPRGARWMDWRIAASIAVLAVGGATFVTTRGFRGDDRVERRAPPAAAPNVGASTQVAVHHGAPPVGVTNSPRLPAAELSAGGSVGDLSENELRTLLRDIEQIDALPPTEPEPVAVRVTSGSLE